MSDSDNLVKSLDVMVIEPDMSLQKLCSLLVECEKAQTRYQWTSGLLIATLMAKPDTPKNRADFVEWLSKNTGLVLTQSEILRRLSVYRFYSQFSDQRIINLVELSGVNIAYRASKIINHDRPDHALTILGDCINNPGDIDRTLLKHGAEQKRKLRHVDYIRIKRASLEKIRRNIADGATIFDSQQWVKLDTVFDALAEIDKEH